MSEAVKGQVSAESIVGRVSSPEKLTGTIIPRSKDGLAATVEVYEIQGGYRLVFEDVNGEKTYELYHGKSVYHEWDGTVLQLTSESGTTFTDLKGSNGNPGKNGISPTVEISETVEQDGLPKNVHIVIIKDATGEHRLRISDGNTPYIGANGNWYIGTEDTGKPSRGGTGDPGVKGDKGDPGNTPYIGSNGNWFIGDTDTGKPSRGEEGKSPKFSVEPTDDGISITYTENVNGSDYTKTVDISNGEDGFSPVFEVSGTTQDYVDEFGNERSREGVALKITEKDSEQEVEIWHGETPVRGVDYWTEEDKTEIAEMAALLVDVSGGGGSGNPGGSSSVTNLGTTPLRLTKDSTVKLTCDSECLYSVESDTVAVFDILGGTNTKVTATDVGGHYQVQSDGTNGAWYQSYITIPLSAGLIIGTKYNFVFDAAGMEWNPDSDITAGHWILKDGNGDTLISRNDADGPSKQVREFTATTENLTLVWYPCLAKYFEAGDKSIANVNAIYINREGTSGKTEVVSITASFTGSTVIEGLTSGVTISATPTATVYQVTGSSSGGSVRSRHEGKICVCFGDSVTGNMTAPYDYPTALAEETGMTVVNAGFGGCRMSDTHPTAAYAAFSMVKLADAVASGDWTLQDNNVSGLSTVTNGVEHLAALKEVDWSKVDFVTIAYGTNDIQSAIGIDNTSNPQDTTKYLGALRYSITKILTAYPRIKMLLLTPIYRYWNDEDIDSDSKMFNGGTQHFTEWGDGLLGVAEEYKIPAVDMYRTLGFNSITRTYYFPSTDGTHPNAKGLKVIGGKIAAKLLSEY